MALEIKQESNNLRVLLIDDDEVDRMRTVRLLGQMHDVKFDVTEALSVSEGISVLKNNNFDCILLDYRLTDGDAINFLVEVDAVKGICPPIILQTVMDDEKKALETVAYGAQDYLVKGRFDSTLLMRTIRYSIQRDLLIKERNRLANELKSAYERIQTLEGILPICSYCKKIRDSEKKWEQIESYITKRSPAKFSHSICPECLEREHPDVYDSIKSKETNI